MVTGPANFLFQRSSILDLGLGTGQTDGQTDDGHQCIIHPPYGVHNNNNNNNNNIHYFFKPPSGIDTEGKNFF